MIWKDSLFLSGIKTESGVCQLTNYYTANFILIPKSFIMKYFLVLILVVVNLFVAHDSYAQLSKEEEKEWKTKAKDYKSNPAALKAVFDERDRLRLENAEIADKLDDAESALKDKEAQMKSLLDEVNQLNDQLLATTEMLNMQAQEEPEMVARPAQEETENGLVFKVQVGAYRKRKLDNSMDTSEDLDLEMEGGMQKIILGKFRDYQMAENLRKYMAEIGIKDAWVVPYRDGRRISLKEALKR